MNLHKTILTICLSLIFVTYNSQNIESQLKESHSDLIKNCIKNKEQKKFVIVIPSYNNKNWYKKNLESVFSQTYRHYRVIYIDDCSPDDTHELVKNYLKKINKKDKVTLIKNQERQGALANHFKAIHMCTDDEIIVCLDGDDWFAHDKVLEYYNDVYQDPDIWLTYGQFRNWPTKEQGWCQEYPWDIIRKNQFREFGFWAAQARTYYAWLAKQIKLEDLLCDFKTYESKFFPAAGDVALMFPMLEMAQFNFKFLPDIFIERNVETPLNDFKVHSNLQSYITKFIRNKDKYNYLQNPVLANKESNNSADLIIFSYDRPLQLYALLESIEKYVTGLNNITVIYRTSTPEYEKGYTELKNKFSQVQFIVQGNTFKQDFKPLLLGTILSSTSDYIMLAVDDDIVKDRIDIKECVRAIKKTHAYAFYLRLGKNISYCYMANRETPVPPHTQIEPEIFAYKFNYATGDWSYLPSVSMTIFNKDTLLQEIRDLNFNSPNTFERNFYTKLTKDINAMDKVGLFFKDSKIIEIPVNIVQGDEPSNRNMNAMSKEELLNKFNQRLKIDIRPFHKICNNSPHMEYSLQFIQR